MQKIFVFLKTFTIGKKVAVLVMLMLLFTLINSLSYQSLVNKIGDLGISESSLAILDGHKRQLKDQVDSTAKLLSIALDDVESTDAQTSMITAMLEPIRYGDDGSGYFFVTTLDSIIIIIPGKPQLTGKDLSNTKDENDVYFIRDLAQLAGKGGGFVTYHFDKPGKGLQPKLSYATMIPGTDYVIGSGVYIDNVEEAKQQFIAAIKNESASSFKVLSIAMTSIFVFIIIPVVLWLSRSITGPLRKAIDTIDKVSKGDTDVDLDLGKAIDCAKVMQCNEPSCSSYGKVVECWVESGSFSAKQDCIRTQRGEDCRTCQAFGARTETQELLSIVNGLVESVRERSALAKAIAQGDLTQEITIHSERDELCKALNEMAHNLRDVMSNIKIAGEQMSSGSQQVSDSSQSLSQGATQSAASLEEISATMNEIAAQTTTTAENANTANSLSAEARNAAERGNKQMQQMVDAMHEINEAGQNINKIIKVIDEIAFQTNLLALNAAVEAARAGQHGKGFAVVAEEVRNLAARSAKAAHETAEMIEETVQKAEHGAHTADITAEALVEIHSGITKVTDLVAEIAAASKEQAVGISQVNEGLGQIDQVTQQNTANAEESAAASEQLSSQADQLKQMLSRFTTEQNASPIKMLR